MIDKCTGTGCPLKDACYRYTSPIVSKSQNVIMPPFFVLSKFHCDMYWGDESEVIVYDLELYFKQQSKIQSNIN